MKECHRSPAHLCVKPNIRLGEILTHVAEGIQMIVCEFELLERHQLPHPVSAGGRRVWMDIKPSGHRRLSFPRHRPEPQRTDISIYTGLTHTHSPTLHNQPSCQRWILFQTVPQCWITVFLCLNYFK